mmetsp:Transcript_10488/g.30866  ORF Transcript_10488/g.30866 Transcript_10488/m.30866 type:complete len:88 (+) Transcript_10488:1227-1490(+)
MCVCADATLTAESVLMGSSQPRCCAPLENDEEKRCKQAGTKASAPRFLRHGIEHPYLYFADGPQVKGEFLRLVQKTHWAVSFPIKND